MSNLFKLKDILYFNNDCKVISGAINIYDKANSTKIYSMFFFEENGLKKEIEDIYKNHKININELLFHYFTKSVMTLDNIGCDNSADIMLFLYAEIGEAYYIKISIDLKFKKEREETEETEVVKKMNEEYEIKTFEDFANIPDNRLDDFLIDFKEYIALLKKFKNNDIKVKSNFIWTDDGEHKIKEIKLILKKEK